MSARKYYRNWSLVLGMCAIGMAVEVVHASLNRDFGFVLLFALLAALNTYSCLNACQLMRREP